MSDTKQTHGLTGQYEFRYNIWGSLVLYIEEVCTYIDSNDGSFSPEFTVWRKADHTDLKELDLR